MKAAIFDTGCGSLVDGIVAVITPLGDPDENGAYRLAMVEDMYWEGTGKKVKSCLAAKCMVDRGHTQYPGMVVGEPCISLNGGFLFPAEEIL